MSNKIRATHTEILTFLDEMPITVPYAENPAVVATALTEYYNAMVVLFKKTKNGMNENESEKLLEIMPIPEIKTMETTIHI